VSRTAYQRAVNLSLYRLAHRRAQSRGLPFFSDDVTFKVTRRRFKTCASRSSAALRRPEASTGGQTGCRC
jgi:hypothetical protein